MTDHRPPFVTGTEPETLLAALEYLQESVVRKATGLDDDSVRRPMVPSGTSLLGLVKHLTMAEVFWFQHTFAGDDVSVPSGDLGPGEDFAEVVAAYVAAGRRGREIVAACADMDRPAARPYRRTDEVLTLRWIVVHMVEETARHAGHADILREQLDGQVGR